MNGHDQLLLKGSGILTGALGYSVGLSHPVALKESARSLVLRCEVESQNAPFPSVILKEIKDDPARGFNDWASLGFLQELSEVEGIVPRFYGGDAAERLYLLEDLGEVQSLQDILEGENPDSVRPALHNLATQMGRMAGSSLGKQERYEVIRSSLPQASEVGRELEAEAWLNNLGKALKWFEALNCDLPRGLEPCLQDVFRTYREPGDFLTFTQGDPAPTNNFFRNGTGGLLDFEYGGYRHALYDLSAWQMLCPLPMTEVEEMRISFRRELAKTCLAAQDDALFEREWAFMCAYRGIAILSWIGPHIIRENQPWAQNWTMRQGVVAALSRLETVCANAEQLEPLAEAAAHLGKRCLELWPEYRDAGQLLPKWAAIEL